MNKPAANLCQAIEPKTELLLSRLDNAKNTGRDKWLARCPAHDDRSPSLAIKQVDDRLLIRCFAGCSTESVLATIGLTFADLFPDRVQDPLEPRRKPPRFSRSELFNIAVQEAGILAIAFNDLREGLKLTDTDAERVERAYKTVLDLLCEVRQ